MTTQNTTEAPLTGGALATSAAAGGALVGVDDDLVQDAGVGTENITAADVKTPRLKICQAGSPQRKPDNDKQITGLNELEMFNDLSGEIYGRGPLQFVVVAQMGARGMQFGDDGKTVVDFDVPLNDPRMQFTVDPNTKKRVKPVATLFYEYLLWLPEKEELVALSLSSTMIGTAKELNSKITYPLRGLMNPPAWARTFSFETKMKQDGKFNWGVFAMKQIGETPADVRAKCRVFAKMFAGKKLDVNIDEGDAPAAAGGADNGGEHNGGGTEEPGDM